jgi:hypothetical protein
MLNPLDQDVRDQNFKLDRLTKPGLQQTLVCYSYFWDLRLRTRYGRDLDDEQHQSLDVAALPDVDRSHAPVFPIYPARRCSGRHNGSQENVVCGIYLAGGMRSG